MKTILSNWRLDAPWTPTRNRLSLLISLTVAGIIAGAIHGVLLGLTRMSGGDSENWEPIETGAIVGVVPGLATGLAVILSRRWWTRMVAAAILGAFLYILLTLLYGATFPPLRLAEWRDLATHPIGRAFLQMAPTSSCMALTVHLFRTCSTTLRGVTFCWALSVIIGLQSQCLFWFALRASYLKNPFVFGFVDMLFSRDSMGGLVLAMITGLVTLAVELASLHARSFQRLTLGVAVLAVATIAGLYQLCQAMPLTPASPINALAFGPDGRTLITAHRGDTLRLWQIEGGSEPTAREIRKARLDRSPNEYLSFATNGSQVVATNWGERITIYDATTLQLSTETNRPGCRFGASALSRQGTTIAAVDHLSQDIWMWHGHAASRAFSTNPLLLSTNNHVIYGLGFSADERLLVGAAESSRFLIWEVNTGTLLREYDSTGQIETRSLVPPLQFPVVVASGYRHQSSSDVLWIDEDGKARKTELEVRAVDVCPDGRQYASTNGLRMTIADLIAGQTVHWTPVLSDSEVLAVLAYSRDGDFIATGSSEGRVKIFRAPVFDGD